MLGIQVVQMLVEERECARLPTGELENGKSQMGGRAAEPEESVLGTTLRIIIYTPHGMAAIEGFKTFSPSPNHTSSTPLGGFSVKEGLRVT